MSEREARDLLRKRHVSCCHDSEDIFFTTSRCALDIRDDGAHVRAIPPE